MHPDEETLAARALGEDVGPGVDDHLSSCDECRAVVAELAQTVSVARAAASVTLVRPPDTVWLGVQRELAAPADPVDAGAATSLPTGRRGRGRRIALGWAAVAAAAGVLIGVVGTRAVVEGWMPVEAVVASTTLETLDTQRQAGAASLVRRNDTLGLRVRTEPFSGDPGYLEVWLINRDMVRMVSVGVIDDGSLERRYPVAQRLIEEGYVIVDISREPLDDEPRHSGDSVVRGTLA